MGNCFGVEDAKPLEVQILLKEKEKENSKNEGGYNCYGPQNASGFSRNAGVGKTQRDASPKCFKRIRTKEILP